ncbi:hypothetical protein KUCAC02_031313, partial [Chaenocephalus aceratus]
NDKTVLSGLRYHQQGSGEWEEGEKQKKGQNETGGVVWGEETHLKKRGTERGDRGRNSSTQREKGGSKEGYLIESCSCAHGAGRSCGKVNSTGESNLFQPLAAPAEHQRDECTGAGSVVKTESLWE